MSLSATVSASTSANITLSGVTNYVRIIQNHGGFTQPDSLSRSGLSDLQKGTQLSCLSSYPFQSLQWTSFRLDNIMSQMYAFQVAKSSTASCCGLIKYDIVFLNIGLAWSTMANLFIAPSSGQYFFSISAGMRPNKVFSLQFVVNGMLVKQNTQNGASFKFSSGIDLHSASKLLQLNTGDAVTMTYLNDALYSDSTNIQISLAEFYYSPVISIPVSILFVITQFMHIASIYYSF